MKTCTCGTYYTAIGWQALELVGYMDYLTDGDKRLELRNCKKCGSTVSVRIYCRLPEGIVYQK
jgi:hypothetical protein